MQVCWVVTGVCTAGNGLGDGGAGSVARALVPGAPLARVRRLELYENAISDAGAMDLAAALEVHRPCC